uniref:Nematode cuticle collagen N-terminal domain-containing protein n=1 Tax=Romanomermis culicivorax TaxID=13658 RepID=A0A915IJB5_ROMCU
MSNKTEFLDPEMLLDRYGNFAINTRMTIETEYHFSWLVSEFIALRKFCMMLTREGLQAMSAQVAAIAAIIFSIGTVLGCFIFIPILWQQISSISGEIEHDMIEFNSMAKGAWKEMIFAKRIVSPVRGRFARQAGVCQCNDRNTCPPGNKGAPGDAGTDGLPGESGEPGAPGLPGKRILLLILETPGNYPPVPLDKYGKCVPCPFGPAGPKGQPGPPGGSGPKGAPGQSGPSGADGQTGPPGDAGAPGNPGRDGSQGSKGDNGKDGSRGVKGNPGPKGQPGLAGNPGSPGQPGKPGNQGGPGQNGSPGQNGTPGYAGPRGQNGPRGSPGQPGKDAQYCACPRRRRFT